jgi:hypothetical protein
VNTRHEAMHLISKASWLFLRHSHNLSLLERQVLVPVEVIKEVPVPVERVVYKEVLVPVENSSVAKHERSHTFHETYETMRPAQYEHRSIISEEVRPSQYMTSEHIRSPQVRLLRGEAAS